MEFEIMPARIKNCAYAMNFIQCAECGTVVGVLEGSNIASMLENQEKKLKAISDKLGAS